jgi:hypothetical protein
MFFYFHTTEALVHPHPSIQLHLHSGLACRGRLPRAARHSAQRTAQQQQHLALVFSMDRQRTANSYNSVY